MIQCLYLLHSCYLIRDKIDACHGRGPRSAGWFADYLEQVGEQEISSYILEGGIKGFALAGSEYVEWLNEYNEEVWKKLDSTH